MVILSKEAQEACVKVNHKRGTRHLVLKYTSDSDIDLEHVIHDNDEDDDSTSTISEGERELRQWNAFVAVLPDDACRYALVNFPFHSATDGVTRDRLLFVQWAPLHTTPVKERMLNSMFCKSAELQVQQAVGSNIFLRVEAGNADSLQFETIQEKIRARTTVK